MFASLFPSLILQLFEMQRPKRTQEQIGDMKQQLGDIKQQLSDLMQSVLAPRGVVLQQRDLDLATNHLPDIGLTEAQVQLDRKETQQQQILQKIGAAVAGEDMNEEALAEILGYQEEVQQGTLDPSVAEFISPSKGHLPPSPIQLGQHQRVNLGPAFEAAASLAGPSSAGIGSHVESAAPRQIFPPAGVHLQGTTVAAPAVMAPPQAWPLSQSHGQAPTTALAEALALKQLLQQENAIETAQREIDMQRQILQLHRQQLVQGNTAGTSNAAPALPSALVQQNLSSTTQLGLGGQPLPLQQHGDYSALWQNLNNAAPFSNIDSSNLATTIRNPAHGGNPLAHAAPPQQHLWAGASSSAAGAPMAAAAGTSSGPTFTRVPSIVNQSSVVATEQAVTAAVEAALQQQKQAVAAAGTARGGRSIPCWSHFHTLEHVSRSIYCCDVAMHLGNQSTAKIIVVHIITMEY